MWISKEEYRSLEERIGSLESQLESQREALIQHTRAEQESLKELKLILNGIKKLAEQ